MLRRNSPGRLRRLALMAALAVGHAPAMAQAGTLAAGAAKVDITPKALKGFYTVWATRFEGVHDPIFARALVIGDGRTLAALVSTDLVEYGDATALRQRIQAELGIPADHVMISASHDHGAPRAGPITPGTSSAEGRPFSPLAYISLVDDRIVQAVREAKAHLQPARFGVGTGRADVNVNRNGWNGKGWGGPDLDRPSDKTVWAVKFASLSGTPIAVVLNYAVHSVVAGPDSRLVTGDLAGAAERAVEHHYGDKAVALWTMGPAGDQNPRYLADPTTRGDGADFAWGAMQAQGTVVGIEAFHAADAITDMTGEARLSAAQSRFTCPTLAPKAKRPGAPAMFPPNPDFNQVIPRPAAQPIQLSMIRLNDVALVGVSAEIFTGIYQELKQASSLSKLVMVTMANDRIGYLAPDAEYDGPFRNANVARGCAATGIVDGLLALARP